MFKTGNYYEGGIAKMKMNVQALHKFDAIYLKVWMPWISSH